MCGKLRPLYFLTLGLNVRMEGVLGRMLFWVPKEALMGRVGMR